MVAWIILLTLVSLSSAIPSKRRVLVEEILPFTQQHPQQGEYVRSFQRDAVERSPTPTFGRLSNYLNYNEFGSHRYPLRDAVESLPANVLYAESSHKFQDDLESKNERLPLRDAVEHREAPFLSANVDHESIWIEPVAPPILRRTQNLEPKIVCRFDSRAVHRTEQFSLFPKNVPDNKCTHLIYDAAILDRENIVLRESYDRDGYNAVMRLRLRDPTLHVLISVTNANLYDGLFIQYFSNVTLSPHESILKFLEEHPFDGIELDWPAAAEDWRSFKNMLKTISAPLAEKGYTLAVALRPEDPVDPELVSIVDLIILRSWRDVPFCQDNTSICEMKNEIAEKIAVHPGRLSFVVQNMSVWIKQVGVEQRSKLVLALPIFGQGYTLKYDNLTDRSAPILGPGKEGEYTKRQDGKLAYYEVCDKLERGLWLSGRDEEGPYVKRGDQWIGYDDPVSVKVKIAFVRATGLGGVALWSLDLDDFQGICGNPWPMLNTAVESLGYFKDTLTAKCSFEYYLFGVDPEDCSKFYSCIKGRLHHGYCGHNRYFDSLEKRCLTITPERSLKMYAKKICKFNASKRIIDEGSSSRLSLERKKMLLRQKGPRVVCYVTSWALYRKEDGKFVPEYLDSQLCTDIVYAFAGLSPETLLMQSFDPWADIENNLYQRVTSIRGSRIILALGGWTDSSGDKYSRLINSDAARRKFVAAAVNYLKEYNFDGLSLEWSYPKCWQSDCKKGPDSDKPNFTKLIQELREEFDRQEPPLLLAVALSGYKEVIDKAYEVREISRVVDFMSVMTYDYHGAWESKTGHIAPLFGSLDDSNPYYNVNFTMSYLVKLGAEKSKLLVGIPLYGQSYRLSTASQAGLGDPTTGPGKPGEFTKQPGMLAYYEICDRIKRHGWKREPGPSAQFEDEWVGYENRESVYAKGKYIAANNYGGASMWTVDLDDFQNRCCSESYPLLKAINRALGRLSTPISEDCQRPPQPVTPQAPTLTTHSDAANGNPHPTTPMTTSSAQTTTWPTWTEKPPSTTTQQTTKTTWPTWSWTTEKPSSKIPEETTKPNPTQEPVTASSTMKTTTRQTTKTTWPTWTWTTEKPSSKIPEETTKSSSTQEPSTTSNTTSWTISSAPTTRPTTTTTQDSIATSEINCINGEYYSDPASCGNYYRCVRGELKREQCAPGLHWDARRHLCDWPSAAKCQTKTGSTHAHTSTTSRRPSLSSTRGPSSVAITTTSTSTTTRPTTPTTTTRFATSRPIVIVTSTQKPLKPCRHGEYYPYPNSCTSFLVCVNGDLVSRQCGPGLNWNAEKNMCDWAFKNPCVETAPHKNALLVEKDSVSATCISGSYSSVPGDCKSYQACLWGRQEVFSCAPGLHFNKETRICDWPARARCTTNDDKETITTQMTMSTTTLSTQSPISPETVAQPTTEQTSATSTTSQPTSTTSRPMSTTSRPTSTTSQPTSTLPSAIIDPDKVSPLSGDFKVVCYFTNWSWYRRGIGRYLPEHIDHTLCTHIVYGFAVLDYSELVIKAHDSWADYDNHFYERVVAYKKRGLKVLLALGGWNDSAGDKYSRLIHSSSARNKFIEHAIRFIEKYGFDGLDLDWEYPVCWQVDCNKGPDSDKERFATLLQELSAKFKPKGLLLSAAVSPSKKVIDKGYDVPALAMYLDWIAVMAYDYHGQWDKKTGHVAPMYYHPDDDYSYFNVNYTINYWISKGAPPKSIVMGMPLYGQSFTINDARAGTGLNSPASAGNAGEFTRAAGFLSYYEICDRVRNRGWTMVQDPEYRMGPYAFKGSQWVSFDDPEMIRRKAQFVRDMGLGGGMVWALDLDDFRGRCGNGPHPLMHVIQRVLAEPRNHHDMHVWTENRKPTTITSTTTSVTVKPMQTIRPTISVDRVTHDSKDGFKVICYFCNWAWYRQEGGRFVPDDIDPDLCTHVLYGFVVLDGTGLTMKSHDPWADIDNKFYEKVAAFKSKGVKVLMALGGWNDSAGDKYSRLVNSPAARQKFVTQALHFIEKYGFEGLDLDWEYPVCWQVDCNKGPESDKEGFSQLVKELSDEFKPRGLLLSAAVSPSKRVIDAGYDVPVLSKYLDWISVMTYDFHGQWDKKTGHVAPLYSLPNDWEPTFNANFSIHYWIEKGANPRKLIMGAPLYGQSFSLAERNMHGLNAPTYGGGEAGEATRARGFLSYYEICDRTLRKGWTVVQDKERRIGPYAYRGDQWVSFDDAQQIKLKAELIKKLNLGGGMVWALDLDDFKNKCGCEPNPLLRTMNRVLRNYPEGPLCPITEGTEAIHIIDVDQTDIESTTISERPMYESTTSPTRPTYIPSSIPITTVTTMTVDTDDTVEIEASSPPPIDCGGLLFLPHKSDCTKYYLCNFGKISEQSCPTGLYWNENRCDWPENTRCNQTAQRQISQSPKLTIVENANDKKIICYYTSWSSKRAGFGKFLPDDINGELCTHIVYAFATLNIREPENRSDTPIFTLKIEDSTDVYRQFLDKAAEIRRKNGVKILLGLGGWNDSKDNKYSRLANSSIVGQFAQHAAQFVQKYGFDGLDLDWEFPVCWQADCNRGPQRDSYNFYRLLRKFNEAFRSKGLLLSIAVSASKIVIDNAYVNIPSLVEYVDWIGVMGYDYHNALGGETGHVAPLYHHPNDHTEFLNVNFSMRYWLDKGVPAEKIIMGIPAYGSSFTLSAISQNYIAAPPGLHAGVSGPGEPGRFTKSAGFLAYYEICDNVRNDGWSVTKDPEERLGPYATKRNQWVSYDDTSYVAKKVELIKELNLGGSMIWSIDLDDFKDLCGCGKYPLLTTLNRKLGRSQPGRATNCT